MSVKGVQGGRRLYLIPMCAYESFKCTYSMCIFNIIFKIYDIHISAAFWWQFFKITSCNSDWMTAYFKKACRNRIHSCVSEHTIFKSHLIAGKIVRITLYCIVFSLFYAFYGCRHFFCKQQRMKEACCTLPRSTAMFLFGFVLWKYVTQTALVIVSSHVWE